MGSVSWRTELHSYLPGFETRISPLASSSRILNTTFFESWEIIGPYPSWWLFNGLLLILQVLHVIWSYLIVRIAFKALIRGKVRTKDGFFLWGWVARQIITQ